MRLIPPAVVVRQEQDRLFKEKENPKEDRIPHRIVGDGFHEMLQAPYFEERSHNVTLPAQAQETHFGNQERRHRYNLRTNINRPKRYQ